MMLRSLSSSTNARLRLRSSCPFTLKSHARSLSNVERMAALSPLPALLSGLPMMVERPIPERAKEVGLVLNLLLGSLARMLQSSCSSPTLSWMTKPHLVQISSPDSTSIIFWPSPQLGHIITLSAGFIIQCEPLRHIRFNTRREIF
jgi:hypothetical protein